MFRSNKELKHINISKIFINDSDGKKFSSEINPEKIQGSSDSAILELSKEEAEEEQKKFVKN